MQNTSVTDDLKQNVKDDGAILLVYLRVYMHTNKCSTRAGVIVDGSRPADYVSTIRAFAVVSRPTHSIDES